MASTFNVSPWRQNDRPELSIEGACDYKSDRLKRKTKGLLIKCILILLFCAGTLAYNGALNYGDYGRVYESMGFVADALQPLKSQYPISEAAQATPMSTMALIGFSLVAAHKALGLQSFCTESLFVLLNIIFFSGLYRCIIDNNKPFLVSIWYSMLYLAYAFYFRSLYRRDSHFGFEPLARVGSDSPD